jgi:chromosome segregation ATPase
MAYVSPFSPEGHAARYKMELERCQERCSFLESQLRERAKELKYIKRERILGIINTAFKIMAESRARKAESEAAVIEKKKSGIPIRLGGGPARLKSAEQETQRANQSRDEALQQIEHYRRRAVAAEKSRDEAFQQIEQFRQNGRLV